MNTYLIYIAHGIGDFVIAMPLIQSIKSQDPTAVIDIFTCSEKRRIDLNKTMVELQGDILVIVTTTPRMNHFIP